MTGANGDRTTVKDIVIVISDGGTPPSQQQFLRDQRDILNNVAYILPVAISTSADTAELLSIGTDNTGTQTIQTISQFRYPVKFSLISPAF